MAGPQLALFYLQSCQLHSCQVDRIEKCPSTKSAACGLRNTYPVSVWCNSATPCIQGGPKGGDLDSWRNKLYHLVSILNYSKPKYFQLYNILYKKYYNRASITFIKKVK